MILPGRQTLSSSILCVRYQVVLPFMCSITVRLQKRISKLGSRCAAAYGNDFNKYAATWDDQWTEVADAAVTVFPYIKKTFGDYPYRQYSFIHGGDGGMEYPNCTMISGPGLGTAIS
jgi:hypothetical protein